MVICPSIGLDHKAVLGNTHAEIATEKAGVLKNGASFIYATDRTDVEMFLNRRRMKKVLKTMSWVKISPLKGLAIPLILFTRSRGWRV